MSNKEDEEFVYVAILRIPNQLHAVDLRFFFSSFVESSKFQTFHFLHRKEQSQPPPTSTTQSIDNKVSNKKKKIEPLPQTCCCVVKMQKHFLNSFQSQYHGKIWKDRNGKQFKPPNNLCILAKLSNSLFEKNNNNVENNIEIKNTKTNMNGFLQDVLRKHKAEPKLSKQDPLNRFQTNKEKKEQLLLQSIDLQRNTDNGNFSEMEELFPPENLPNGNVGTASIVLMKGVENCTLPAIILKKLGVRESLKRIIVGKYRKYGAVPMDYLALIEGGNFDLEQNEKQNIEKQTQQREMKNGDIVNHTTTTTTTTPTTTTTSTSTTTTTTNLAQKFQSELDQQQHQELEPNEDEEGVDSDQEDWDRHISAYGHTEDKVKLNEPFHVEHELDVTWEKGGSGLVFWMDDTYWDEMRGEMDARETDDVDVDIPNDDFEREGSLALAQEKRENVEKAKREKEKDELDRKPIGFFEKYNHKKIASKLMKKMGWQVDKGLGKNHRGILTPLELTSQITKNGLGFFGKIGQDGFDVSLMQSHKNSSRKRKREQEEQEEAEPVIHDDNQYVQNTKVKLTTLFDNPNHDRKRHDLKSSNGGVKISTASGEQQSTTTTTVPSKRIDSFKLAPRSETQPNYYFGEETDFKPVYFGKTDYLQRHFIQHGTLASEAIET